MTTKPRVFLAEDQEILRTGLRTLLDRNPRVEVVGESSEDAAVESIEKSQPSIILLGMGHDNLRGIVSCQTILTTQPDAKIVALSVRIESRFVRPALQAGVRGYLQKSVAVEELSAAIEAVHLGRSYICQAVMDEVLNAYVIQSEPAARSTFVDLSPREKEVATRLAEGMTTKQIAALLNVSSKTIETHRSHIMQKLQLTGLAQLTKYAIVTGLTTLDY